MNCKNCGFALTDANQTCPNCGTVNGVGENPIQNEVVVPVTEPLTQPVTPVVQPVAQPVPNPVVASNIVEPKKKSKVGLIVIVIIALAIFGGGGFLAINFIGHEPDTPPAEETNKTDNGKVEDSTSKYAINQVPIDNMTDEELFELVHKTLDYKIVDGESTKSFYKRLEISKLGKEPTDVDVKPGGVEYSFMRAFSDDGDLDYIESINVSSSYDFDNSLIYNSKSEEYERSGYVTIIINSDKAKKLYEMFINKYIELYPESKNLGEWKSGSVAFTTIDTQNKMKIKVHLKGDNFTDTLTITEEVSK